MNILVKGLHWLVAVIGRGHHKPPPPPPPPPPGPGPIMGVCWRIVHEQTEADIDAHLTALIRAGARRVSITCSHYVYLPPGSSTLAYPPPEWTAPDPPLPLIYRDQGEDPAHPFRNTPSLACIAYAARQAATAGLEVVLKIHIDSYDAAWRGFIGVGDLAADFARAYKEDFLAPYIALAQTIPGCALCMGCELLEVSRDLGVVFWLDVLSFIRDQGFTGPVVYAANWGENTDAEFLILRDLWPHLAAVGVDAYFPLGDRTPGPSPDLATLTAGWHYKPYSWMPATDDLLLQTAQEAGVPLWFTEIGYPAIQYAYVEPYRDPTDGDVQDDGLQVRCAQAFHAAWNGKPGLIKADWWVASQGVAADPKDDDILAKPAMCAAVFGSGP